MQIQYFNVFNRPQILIPYDTGESKCYDKDNNEYDACACVTCDIGYVPVRKRIERMIQTGIHIQEYLRGNYEYGDQEMTDDMQPDPTDSGDFDPADAAQFAMNSQPIEEMLNDIRAYNEKVQAEASDGHQVQSKRTKKGTGNESQSPAGDAQISDG